MSVRVGNYARVVPENELPGLVAAYMRGEPIQVLVDRYGVTRQALSRLLRRRGVPIRPRNVFAFDDREQVLNWLRAYPEYRETIRQRVSEAAKRAELKSQRLDRAYEDRDYLGRDIDGCG